MPPDPERIAARLEELWQIARGPGGGADRPAYSAAEAEAMRRVAGWAAELGLSPALDRHGNLWALPAGWGGPVITAGSHVDTVPDGGRYDGALGTVLGLELVADLQAVLGGPDRGGVRPGLLVCAAEEAPRFGAGTIGSRLLSGALPEAALDALHDDAGVSAAEARAEYLAALAELDRVADEAPLRARVRAHAEIHVALRIGAAELGIVTRVASPRRLEIRLRGEAGHAGEVAMSERRDALAGAAEIVLAVERAAGAGARETVATVGTLEVLPGAVSVIPAEARMGLDLRAIDADALDALERAVRDAIAGIGERRALEAEVTLVRGGAPVALAPGLARAALSEAAARGIAAAETWSGAGHDAQHIAAFAPSLLVFVPLHGGQSHTPQEGAEMAEVLQAAEVVSAVLSGMTS